MSGHRKWATIKRKRLAADEGRTTPSGRQPERALSTLELAHFLGVSPSTARRLFDSGRLPGWRTEGGHRRVSEATARAHRSAVSTGEEPLARWLAAAEAVLSAAEDALGPDTPQGRAFNAAAAELHARLGEASGPAPA